MYKCLTLVLGATTSAIEVAPTELLELVSLPLDNIDEFMVLDG